MNIIYLLVREIKYFTNFQNKMYQFLLFFQPLIFLTIVYFLQQLRGDVNTDRFVVASALISMWSYVLYSSGSSLVSQRWNDTLKLIIAAPMSLFQVIISKAFSNSIIALITMVLSFIYAKFIFGFSIHIENYYLFYLSVLVLIFSLCVVGLILAIVFASFQNVFDYQNLIHTPIILICGVFIPVDQLPAVIEYIAYGIPMTWGIKAVYEAIDLNTMMYTSMIVSIFVSFIYLFLAVFIIRKMEMVLRQHGKWGAM
ncbi:ABC transporter permease [Lentibacillus sediminis]|uniref:ABC transporter permease n=1 Tax=Lentibacillus sediminis TaxID=1940529 RepID=UPI0013042A4C|nr:ABC transporter permease [Lentibacillus sediminis]